METLRNYIESLAYKNVGFIFECIIVLFTIILLLFFIIKVIRSKKIGILFISDIICFIICFILELKIGYIVSTILLFVIILYGLSYYIIGTNKKNIPIESGKENKQFITSEESKEKLIETIIKTAEHLSNRNVGAIITIEREHNLNTLIEGAVKLDAEVTFELLETIFHPNTRLHDGAVIIRGDRVMCASAFFQPSQKKDIPQHYGSRHRAAIGISEQSDAFTIVVSEETGQIATTVEGTLNADRSLEALRQELEDKIIVR